MRFIRTDIEPLLEKDGLCGAWQIQRIDIPDRRGRGIWISQAGEREEISAQRMESVLGVPGQQGFAARPKLFVFVALDRQDIVYQSSVLLSRPTKRVTEQ